MEKQVVLTYALKGLHTASQKFRAEPEAQKQLGYLLQVGKFRMCQNPIVVSKVINNMRELTIDHVHPNALKNEMVGL